MGCQPELFGSYSKEYGSGLDMVNLDHVRKIVLDLKKRFIGSMLTTSHLCLLVGEEARLHVIGQLSKNEETITLQNKSLMRISTIMINMLHLIIYTRLKTE